MERWNSESIPRSHILWALKTPRIVMGALKIDKCMICQGPKVNEAGICPICWAMLDEDELRQAEKWLNGSAP